MAFYFIIMNVKELIYLENEKDISFYIRSVMSYFSCNEQMAKTIIESAKKNGEYGNIMNMCAKSPSERRN